MSLLVKICGLKTPETLAVALDEGADMVGFVFFPKSPRNVSLDEARALGALVQGRAKKVALTVDASDEQLAAIVEALQPDILQLHGHETAARIVEVRQRFGLPVMRAVGIATRDDLHDADDLSRAADHILFDAKPPKDAAHPGGNGLAFDWTLLSGLKTPSHFMLSGGLDPETVGEAIALSGASGVDVSSGVESAPGIKDPVKIAAFIRAARSAENKN